jgi:hypothetical protein
MVYRDLLEKREEEIKWHELVFFFLNGRRVSKDPEEASYWAPRYKYRQTPKELGDYKQVHKNAKRTPMKSQKAIRSFGLYQATDGVTPRRPPRHHQGTKPLGGHGEQKLAGHQSEGGVPYTHWARTGRWNTPSGRAPGKKTDHRKTS